MQRESDFDVVIIGAGVVGLACAAYLGELGKSVVVLESEGRIGTGISSRNSGVIHAGIYYPTGSLKHRLCLRGATLLYEHLPKFGVPFLKCGKVIVATSGQELEAIERLYERARENEVPNVELATSDQIAALESAVHCVGGMLSPETGIVDVHAYMLSLLARIEESQGVVALNTPFVGSQSDGSAHVVTIGGAEEAVLRTDWLINCAGLSAPQIARQILDFPDSKIPRQWVAKGHYFSLSARSPFKRLVYPVPSNGGLGVHATLDLAGSVRFGPDIDWSTGDMAVESLDYSVPVSLRDAFATSIRTYWPDLPVEKLVPDFAGYRPKISAPGDNAADFSLQFEADHRVPRLINMFGIESPGVTSSLAIAEIVSNHVGSDGER